VKSPDIVLVTEANPRPENVQYMRPELEPLVAAFAKRGVAARLGAWDDPAFDWSSAGLALLRCPWNYYRCPEAFLAWTKRVPRLLNPPGIVAWNANKAYLRELEQRGVPVVPTEWIDSSRSLDAVLERRGWTEAVLKPVVSAGAWRTRRFRRGEAPQALLEEILSAGGAMLQPYLPSVESHGERSLIYFGGALSHAVRRQPPLATGQHGATPTTAAADELELAGRTLATQPQLLYARVDLARDLNDRPCLMELELIEPSFFLGSDPGAADRFVGAALERA
jgi:hypothetical protein